MTATPARPTTLGDRLSAKQSPTGQSRADRPTAEQSSAEHAPTGQSTADQAPAGRMPRPMRRRQLLGAAREVFVANGYHAAAMDDIANRAGVSKPVLYQHFPGKLDLYLALLDAHADELVQQVQAALSATTDNKTRVHNAISAYFDFVDGASPADEGAFRLVFESDLRNEPAVRERVDRMNRLCMRAIAETVAADTGLARAEAELLSTALIGVSEVAARYWLQTERTVPKQEAVRLLAALAWRGISAFPRQAELG